MLVLLRASGHADAQTAAVSIAVLFDLCRDALPENVFRQYRYFALPVLAHAGYEHGRGGKLLAADMVCNLGEVS